MLTLIRRFHSANNLEPSASVINSGNEENNCVVVELTEDRLICCWDRTEQRC